MRGSAEQEPLDGFVEKLDMLHSCETICFIKATQQEKTELVCTQLGQYLIKKTIASPQVSGTHPYELLEGHSCPYLPKIELAIRIGDELIVLMERIEGETLRQHVAQNGPMDAQAALSTLSGVIRGIEYLHGSFAAPIVHRDIKPDNIIVLPDGSSRLIDFGIARLWQKDAAADTRMMGSRGYAAPEQFGFAQTDTRTDVYALGMTVRFALTGKDPEEEADIGDIALSKVIEQACAFDPSSRYAWVVDFYADFKAAAALASGAHGSSPVEEGHRAEEPDMPPLTNEVETSHTSEDHSFSPGFGWRALQVMSLLFAVLFFVIGIQALLGTNGNMPSVGTCALSLLTFSVPLFVLGDPFDILRKRGVFDIGTGRRLLRVVGIGFGISCVIIVFIEPLLSQV